MSFVHRLLSFQFGLAEGVFDGGGNAATVTGLRASVKIAVPGSPDMAALSGEIYGLPLSMMNQLTTLGTQQTIPQKNTLTVSAGDDTNGMFEVYQGTITVAFVNAQAQPEVSFHVECLAGLFEAVQSAQPTSQQGGADVATLMGQFAQQMRLQFENNGVNVQLSNPYLHGSARDQAIALAKDAGINSVIDKGVLAIWPAGGSRQGSAPLISPQPDWSGIQPSTRPASWFGRSSIRRSSSAARFRSNPTSRRPAEPGA